MLHISTTVIKKTRIQRDETDRSKNHSYGCGWHNDTGDKSQTGTATPFLEYPRQHGNGKISSMQSRAALFA